MTRALKKNKDKDVKNKDKDEKPTKTKAEFIDELLLLKDRIAYAARKKVRETALKATTAPPAA